MSRNNNQSPPNQPPAYQGPSNTALVVSNLPSLVDMMARSLILSEASKDEKVKEKLLGIHDLIYYIVTDTWERETLEREKAINVDMKRDNIVSLVPKKDKDED